VAQVKLFRSVAPSSPRRLRGPMKSDMRPHVLMVVFLLQFLPASQATATPHLRLHFLEGKQKKHHKLTTDGMPQELGMLMREAQAKLSKAQAHHQKVVDKARSELSGDFAQHAEVLAAKIQAYSSELNTAEVQLEEVLAASKEKLQKARSTQDSRDWRSPMEADTAKLSAQIVSAEHLLQHARRQDKRAVEHATDEAEQPLEDAAQRLSLKLGDLTEVYNQAKAKLEAGSTEATEGSKVSQHGALAGNVSAADVAAAATHLIEASNKQRAVAKNAAQNFTAFVEKVSANVSHEAASILDSLATAQQQELAKVGA